jgi:predicted protein tyrosine phosphatase
MSVIVTIRAFADVAGLLRTNQYDAVISIKNPKGNDNWTNSELIKRRQRFQDHSIDEKNILCMSFVDTDNPFHKESPRGIHVSKIMNLASNLKEYMKTKAGNIFILVHCIAGISRSTAAAMILLEEMGHSREDAKNRVFAARSIAEPNSLMLKLYYDHKDLVELNETLDALVAIEELSTEKIDR